MTDENTNDNLFSSKKIEGDDPKKNTEIPAPDAELEKEEKTSDEKVLETEEKTEPETENENTPESDEDSPALPLSPPVTLGKNQLDIVTDMEESYLSYAMSVIVSRALPDVRDGLKPVHRRILYAMHENGLRASAKYRKSANVVGAVLGKYHPHGDSAVYQSMVRMAQDFSLRYPLVDGQGNFGSIDGDNAAAMRYTEAKMTRIADTMLTDIEKKTVDFRPNYDATAYEPSVLPSILPQLLLNGTMGIAVGMATNIPPHNLREIVAATSHLLFTPGATIEDLLKFVKGPDFPTGAEIYDGGCLTEMYHTGRGGVMMRARAQIEEMKGGKHAIVVTEIPYQVNKAELIIKIADLVRDKKIAGITDLRDETARDGIRVVIELKKDSYPKKILNQLFKMTQLQKSFNLNMIALVDGIHPKLLNLKEVLQHFIDHRFEVIRRRTEYDLQVARDRAHILEGLKIALDHIDEVIATIRASETKEIAGENLIKQFGLSEKQAKAILEMRLQTLAGLERKKIEDELAEVLETIKKLEAILSNRELQAKIINDEMLEAAKKFGDARKTIVHKHALGKFEAKDTIPDEEMLAVLTKENYIKRVSPSAFRTQRRGGVGVVGVKTKDEDVIAKARYGTNHNELLFFTSQGRVFQLPMYEIPEASRQAKGTPIVNLLQLQQDERITEILNLSQSIGEYLFFCTTKGTVKKTALEEFKNVRRSGLIAQKIKSGESLLWVRVSSGEDEVFIVSREGKSIRFPEKDVRSMGRSASGVRGIKLKPGDEVVEMELLRDDTAKLLVVMENGLGKMSKVSLYRGQSRGGSGIKVANVTAKTGKIAGARVVSPDVKGDLLMVAEKGQTIRVPLADIKTSGRATQGVILMRPSAGDKVSSVSLLLDLPEGNGDAQEKLPEK
ncbi:DNA gyrase subunit A [bacterium]|jgi:DNA gyrase subunit A|nr:DNA gyrase subunit A [bacterium]MBT6831718.1 DNA gyrase subunit A [bacterium]MBT6996541.1 DNA gyrase subunit A [bacterium]MBT7772867.1 DNA gyrase subunit A [bacterium]